MTAIKFEEFFDNKSLDKLASLYEIISKEQLTVKDTGINYRVINHWDEKGLIHFARNTKEGNRKFSFVDFIWIKVVNEFREFGVKLKDIQMITKDLYAPLPMQELMDSLAQNLNALKEYKGEAKEEFLQFMKSGEYKTVDFSFIGYNYLQILIAEAIATRQPVSILLFNNGEWFPFIKGKEELYPEELLYKMEYSSHVSVSITDIIFRHIVEDELHLYFENLNIFTKNEISLLNHIMNGNFKKVTVILKSKNGELLEFKKGKEVKEKLMKIIRLKQYREFILIDNKNNEIRIGKPQNEKIKG